MQGLRHLELLVQKHFQRLYLSRLVPLYRRPLAIIPLDMGYLKLK